MEIITFVFEIIGTVAFAVSGALVAVEKKMDVLGVVILGITTAVGGGITRDIILGYTPPQAFVKPVYLLTALAVSVIIFIPSVRTFLQKKETVFEKFLLYMDSLGLCIFTVMGINTAQQNENIENALLLVFVGVLTGVGGGVMRDIMASNTPFIFKKHFYASAAIIGATVTVILWNITNAVIAEAAGALIIFVLRLLAARFRWKLPRVK